METVVHKADMLSCMLAVKHVQQHVQQRHASVKTSRDRFIAGVCCPYMVLLGSITCACMYCTDHDNDYDCSVDSKKAYRLQEIWLSDV